MVEEPCCLSSLPAQDVLFPFIFQLLSPEDWFSLRAVNTSLHILVSQFFEVNKKLDLSLNKRLTEQAFITLTTNAKGLRHINLAGLKIITDDLLRNVIKNNPNLECLNLSECHHLTSGIMQTVSSSCGRLEKLILGGCHWVSRESLDYHSFHQGLNKSPTPRLLLPSLPRVGRPNLPTEGIKSRGSLKEVDLTGCWELEDNSLIKFLSSFPDLRVLKLANIYSLTDKTLQAIVENCSNIRLLDISGCWRISDVGVDRLAEYSRKLEMLSVTDCRDVTERSLSRLRQKGVRLDRKLDPVLLRLHRLRQEQRQARLQI